MSYIKVPVEQANQIVQLLNSPNALSVMDRAEVIKFFQSCEVVEDESEPEGTTEEAED